MAPRHTTEKKGRLAWLLTIALTLAPAAPGWAETPCELALEEADAAYQAGRFAAAIESIEACLGSGPTREERELAAQLRARVHLADDDLERARQAVEELLASDPAYAPNTLTDPPRLVRLVAAVRRESGTVQVSSVSKTSESLREAPATVQVVTAEQIERRGYLDLEDLLHDLPGFDISRTNGIAYSNVYQRGYRSDLTTRTLLLVDGVEENDLWGQIAYLSRQYPLSSIERVEVIYGPASTMYGANAFAGVINVVTKEPEPRIAEGRAWSLAAQVSGGEWNTEVLDATLAGRTGNGSVSWSLTGRVFRSDEQDLSHLPDWDYSLGEVDYRPLLRIGTPAGVAAFRQLLASRGLADCTGRPGCLYELRADGVELTPAGAAAARALDESAYRELGGRPVGFSDETDDWALQGKVKLPNLVFGFQVWRQAEGMGAWHTERSAPGEDNGMTWIPRQAWVYLKYARPLSRDLALTLFSQYKLHELGQPTVANFLKGYARQRLTLNDLVLGTPATWETSYLYQLNSQLRNELSLAWNPSRRFSLVGGAEVRNSSLQGDYVFSSQPNPQDNGVPGSNVPGGNRFNVVDAGVYAQASYRPWQHLKVVAGGRVDVNQAGRSGGYGTVFNPRLAVVWTPRDLVFKAIWSKAFQDASNFQKYVTFRGGFEIPSPDLAPERVENLELTAGWQPARELAVDLALYSARYSSIAQLQSIPCNGDPRCSDPNGSTRRFAGIGEQEIRGAAATATLTRGWLTLSGSYTYTEPYNTAPKDGDGQPLRDGQGRPIGRLRIADIASHQVKAVAEAALGDRWSAALRTHYVGARRTGRGTTNPTNPLAEVDPHVVAHAAVTYAPLAHLKLQLLAGNLLDADYADPGIRQADGIEYAAALPQPRRSLFLRFLISR